MRSMFRAAGLVALALTAGAAAAHADGVNDSVWIDPAFPATPPGGRDLTVDVMPDAPSYPGPSVDTWLGRRYPPPAPPAEFDFSAAPAGRPGLGVAQILVVVGGSSTQDQSELDACVADGEASGMDYVDALGVCFCLIYEAGEASGCAAEQ